MIEDQSHGVLQVLELGRLNLFYLIVRDFSLLDQSVELLSREVLEFQTKSLGYIRER